MRIVQFVCKNSLFMRISSLIHRPRIALPAAATYKRSSLNCEEDIVMAVTKFWTGGNTSGQPLGGDWNTPDNWSPSGVPADGDKVVLGGDMTSSAYTVTLNTSSADIKSVTVGGSGGFPTLDVQALGF